MTEKTIFSINDLIASGVGCRSKIHQLIRDRKLIARKSGSRTVVLHDDLQRYLDSLPKVGDRAA